MAYTVIVVPHSNRFGWQRAMSRLISRASVKLSTVVHMYRQRFASLGSQAIRKAAPITQHLRPPSISPSATRLRTTAGCGRPSGRRRFVSYLV